MFRGVSNVKFYYIFIGLFSIEKIFVICVLYIVLDRIGEIVFVKIERLICVSYFL